MKCRLCGTAVEFDVLKSHEILCKEKENELLDGNEDGVEHILATPATQPLRSCSIGTNRVGLVGFFYVFYWETKNMSGNLQM